METEYVVVFVTTATKREAEKIANHLLNDKLIACANIVGPVTSLYAWQENVERSKEYLILMKSKRNLFNRLNEVVKTMHSYEVPEILALQVVEGSRIYLDWLASSLT